jgi:murein DD-endopeptidase MepM/ murein hydrolase activator NlpD
MKRYPVQPIVRVWNTLLALILVACTPTPAPGPATTRISIVPTPIAEPTTQPSPVASVQPSSTPQPQLQATAIQSTPTAAPVIAAFFDDQRLTYEPNYYSTEIQRFLDSQPGPLKNMRFSVGDRRHSLPEVLIGQTSYYGVNPKVILALIEAQSGAISSAGVSSDQLAWAVGYQGERGNWRGLQSQVRWAVRQLFYARRDYPAYAPLTYADNSQAVPQPGWPLSEYVIARVLAQTTSPGNLSNRMNRFLQAYTRLFGDPRIAPADWPVPAKPFMYRPTAKIVPVSSFFDHDAPFLSRDPEGTVTTYWGRAETDASFAYDGHDGWDYAAAPPDKALAAASGIVVFAGNADDGCATRAVIVDHQNGYRTLYWHLARIDVEIGQSVAAGDILGVIGNSGCSLGPHLHFGTQYLGRGIDPYGWCNTGIDPWQAHAAGTKSRWLWADRPSPCEPPPAGAIVVDTGDIGFYQAGDGWQEVPTGYNGSTLFVGSIRGSSERESWRLRPLHTPAVAIWRTTIPKAGTYRVIAYIPYALSGLEDPQRLFYRVHSAAGEAQIQINGRANANDWAELGTYEYATGDVSAVILSNQSEEARLSVWADAVMWIPVDR